MFEELLISVLFIIVLIILCIISNLYSKKKEEKEKYIIIERYLKGRTQLELASEIGISQAQISRLEKSGLKTIKKMME